MAIKLSKNKIIWIIGYGNFGQKALKKINKNLFKKTEIIVVDKKKYNLFTNDFKVISYNAIDLFSLYTEKKRKLDWIIPTLPFHLLANILNKKYYYTKLYKEYLSKKRNATVKLILKKFLKKIPNGAINQYKQLYLSCSNWICLDNCSEKSICEKTGKINRMHLFKILANSNPKKIENIVLKSRQLLPGIGGYKYKDLLQILKTLSKHNEIILINSTSCKCHAIFDFFLKKNI